MYRGRLGFCRLEAELRAAGSQPASTLAPKQVYLILSHTLEAVESHLHGKLEVSYVT
jgi:hypothetical protein